MRLSELEAWYEELPAGLFVPRARKGCGDEQLLRVQAIEPACEERLESGRELAGKVGRFERMREQLLGEERVAAGQFDDTALHVTIERSREPGDELQHFGGPERFELDDEASRRRPAQAGRLSSSSRRAAHSMRTGVWVHLPRYSTRSSSVGSAQWMSSSTRTTGRSRAIASKNRRTAQKASLGAAGASIKPLSSALFGLVYLSFLLPFASVSCDGASTSFTGAQLVTHTVPAGGAVSASDCKDDISTCVEARGSWLALIALALALAGLVFGLRGRQKGPGWFATGGFLTMLGLVGQGLITFATVEFRAGLWAMLLLFFAAMCLHGGYALQRRREDPQPEPQAFV